MRRLSPIASAILGLSAMSGWAGTLPWGMPGPAKKPHPTTERLREYTATLRTNIGDITLELSPEAAPNAVRTFVKLAERGAYDGARVTCAFKDRMIVIGPPAAGAKDAPEPLAYEAAPSSAIAGAVLMDRGADGRTLPNRLMFLLSDQEHLEGDYTVFAHIEKGLDVAKRLGAAATRSADGTPVPVEDLLIEQVLIHKKPSPDAKESKN